MGREELFLRGATSRITTPQAIQTVTVVTQNVKGSTAAETIPWAESLPWSWVALLLQETPWMGRGGKLNTKHTIYVNEVSNDQAIVINATHARAVKFVTKGKYGLTLAMEVDHMENPDGSGHCDTKEGMTNKTAGHRDDHETPGECILLCSFHFPHRGSPLHDFMQAVEEYHAQHDIMRRKCKIRGTVLGCDTNVEFARAVFQPEDSGVGP